MIILIECDGCRTRFRLDDKMFKGFKAMRVRCRKCGAFITAWNPAMSPAMEPAENPRTARIIHTNNSPDILQRSNSWWDEGFRGMSTQGHAKKIKNDFRRSGYGRVSNYVLACVMMLVGGCSVYFIFSFLF